MNMLARWILGLAIGFGLLLANTGLTSAYYFGSRWHWVNGSSCCLNLNYANTMDTTQAYGTEFDQGATDWSGTASPPYLNKVSYMYHALQDGIKKPQSMDISDINQLYQNANWSPGKTTC